MLTFCNHKNNGQKTMPAANMGLAKSGLTCFADTFVQDSTFVLRMNFIAITPALRQAQNRCMQVDKNLTPKVMT